MAGAKKMLPAPIDRPLSRAYLREFTGWSTAFPPTLSDPTSVQTMENVFVQRDGAMRVRPGLHYMSYIGGSAITVEGVDVVGTHEVFFLNTGDKAYLFAVREVDSTVGFRVAQYNELSSPPFQVKHLTDTDIEFDVPQTEAVLNFTAATTYVKYVQIDNKILALSNAGEEIRMFFVGEDKIARKILPVPHPEWVVADKLTVVHPDFATEIPTTTAPVAAETKTANTLIDSTAADNQYNFGYFYTFINEIGESAGSQIAVVKAQRGWSAWNWESANASGEPTGTYTADPAVAADQLVAYMPEAVYDDAKAAGAIGWNLYMLTWSDQDPVPPEGVLLETKSITSAGGWASEGWIRHTPQSNGVVYTAALPNDGDVNSTIPSMASQGLVAADRLVLVNDPTAAAVIRWSSNLQGDYTNFSANKGGGYKTLTSGNLYTPAAVKLWQNPQSADTITVLCQGVDGMSTGYYMQPAQVASQSDAVNIMGFEETTATPGTTSPYGCEVFNNALYHPLDDQLMKSTASNYNINHKSITDQVENMWSRLANKHRIVSSQHDNRIYYIVHNTETGAELEDGCMGNEIWVFDGAAENGTWSRWLIQACSLRKIEVLGRIYMSVVRPDGIYYLDPEYLQDDVVVAGEVEQRFIAWQFVTNTQGANRAHDAWCMLQQLGVTLGNFQGTLRYGISSWDLHGKAVVREKIVRDLEIDPLIPTRPIDLEDQLLVQRQVQQWFFYAESVTEDDVVLASSGQINAVQYRYAPVSVNVGYEYGSVETFEYGRATANWAQRTTDNGVPTPFNDPRRP